MLEMYECEHEWTSWRLCKRGLILWIGTIHDLVKLLGGKKAFKNKCLKHEKNTSHSRYKARLEVRGFVQKKGVDYDQIFSKVVKMSTIRVVLGITTGMNMEIEQLNVKATFLQLIWRRSTWSNSKVFEVKGTLCASRRKVFMFSSKFLNDKNKGFKRM